MTKPHAYNYSETKYWIDEQLGLIAHGDTWVADRIRHVAREQETAMRLSDERSGSQQRAMELLRETVATLGV